MCNIAFDTEVFPFRVWNDFPMPFKPFSVALKALQSIVSGILVHELTHISVIGTVDVNHPNSYGWTDSVGMLGMDAFQNAENYMYLAMLSKLEASQYTLASDEGDAKLGQLLYQGRP